VQRPLLPPETSSAVAALWAQCSGLGDRHESCLNLGNLASADRFAAEHERVAAQLTDPKRPASLLVHERGWDADHYAGWLADAWRRLLLRDT